MLGEREQIGDPGGGRHLHHHVACSHEQPFVGRQAVNGAMRAHVAVHNFAVGQADGPGVEPLGLGHISGPVAMAT